ncbi:MAG TPA: hypothetical protein VF765_21750 [Polyangiaceae bacterium]
MNRPARSHFFLCCPLCGHRMPRDWLTRASTAFRRWGFILSYPGRRQIHKAGEVYVSTTPPEQARQLIGEAGEALAALASALVFELSVAGWRPAWLRALGVELIRRRVIEPVVEYVDRVAPPAQQVCVMQPCGPARWEPVSVSTAAQPIVESRPAAPHAEACGPVRWEVIKP